MYNSSFTHVLLSRAAGRDYHYHPPTTDDAVKGRPPGPHFLLLAVAAVQVDRFNALRWPLASIHNLP